ncbi:MAG: HD domain-containing protein [Chloroflexota bacterium]
MMTQNNSTSSLPIEIVDQIFTLMAESANMEYYGEDVSQLEHALQCAKLAADVHSDDETVIAALLHDIGHVCDPDAEQMGDVGAVDHEGIGADFLLGLGFSAKVAELVQAHVVAKRYLTFAKPEYAAKLSPASVETLKHQGGRMTADEATAFEQDPLFKEKLRMRSWDEQGKTPELAVPPLESYRAMVLAHLRG